MTYLNLFLISVCWVIILDLSGFREEMLKILGKILGIPQNLSQNLSLKPITCSLCMTWWTGLGYLVVVHKISFLTITITLLFALFTQQVKDLLYLVQDLITKLFNKISKI